MPWGCECVTGNRPSAGCTGTCRIQNFNVQVRPGSWPARRESWVDVARCEIFCTRGHCQPISLRLMNRRCLCAVSEKKGWKRAWRSRETTGSRTADPFSAHANPCKSLTHPPTPLCLCAPFIFVFPELLVSAGLGERFLNGRPDRMQWVCGSPPLPPSQGISVSRGPWRRWGRWRETRHPPTPTIELHGSCFTCKCV